MKIEYLAQYRKTHPPSLRERLVAYLPRYAPWAARLAPLSNLATRALKSSLGFSANRDLPKWRGNYFVDQIQAKTGSREAVLFVDTFSRWFDPDNVRAAIRVLEAASYRIHVAAPPVADRPLCCGRTFLAAGLVEQAKAEARRTLDVLAPWAERGVAIVGLEPSCLFSFRDEFPVMVPGTEALAKNSYLFEEFLAREDEAGRLELKLQPLETTAYLHGHCHQKAFDAMPAVRKVLGMVPGLKVETIETSCCGMAGSFGYEAEHYDLSMKMAELALLPALRKLPQDALVVADGTSCRHQIADGAGRAALHVARVLARAL